MELGFITIKFDTPGQQKYVEESVDLVALDREVWPRDNEYYYTSWTEFSISSCRAKDLTIFEELEKSWNNLSDEEKETWEKKAEE